MISIYVDACSEVLMILKQAYFLDFYLMEKVYKRNKFLKCYRMKAKIDCKRH